MEFGNYNDNLEALYSANRQIERGRVREGLKDLRDLRNHILRTQDSKSERYLLPNIEFYERTATEYGGLTCCEITSATRRGIARKRTLMIGRYLRAILSFATGRDWFGKARSSRTIPPML